MSPSVLPGCKQMAKLDNQTYLVTGGSGFVGLTLAKALADGQLLAEGLYALELGAKCNTPAARDLTNFQKAKVFPPARHVILLDVQPPPSHILGAMPSSVEFIQGDLRDPPCLLAAMAQPIDTVFHLASYGMSGKELLKPDLIRAVNIGGTRNVIDACLRCHVPRLVYVSTVNAVWHGQAVVNGDESLPYPPDSAYMDEYSRTKAKAEQLVLAANGMPFYSKARASGHAGRLHGGLALHAQGGADVGAKCAPSAAAAAGGVAGNAGGCVGGGRDITVTSLGGLRRSARQRANAAGQPAEADTASASHHATMPSSNYAAAAATGPSSKLGAAGVRTTGAIAHANCERISSSNEPDDSPGVLLTCAVRAVGIYGPGESRHFTRAIRMVRAGLYAATFGPLTNKQDWVHVNNLVQSLLLAAKALQQPGLQSGQNVTVQSGTLAGLGGVRGSLSPSRRALSPARATRSRSTAAAGPASSAKAAAGVLAGSTRATGIATALHSAGAAIDAHPALDDAGTHPHSSAGKVYTVSDGEPINQFAFLRHLVVGLGYPHPDRFNVPFGLVYGIAALLDWTCPLVLLVLPDYAPILSRMEVCKCCVMHHFSIERARRELGYAPVRYGMDATVMYMQKMGFGAEAVEKVQRAGRQRLLAGLVAALLVLLLAWLLR